MNTGTMGTTDAFPVDIEADAVAQAAETTLAAIRQKGDRGQAVAQMGEGAARIIARLVKEGHLKAAISMGGGGGYLHRALGHAAHPAGDSQTLPKYPGGQRFVAPAGPQRHCPHAFRGGRGGPEQHHPAHHRASGGGHLRDGECGGFRKNYPKGQHRHQYVRQHDGLRGPMHGVIGKSGLRSAGLPRQRGGRSHDGGPHPRGRFSRASWTSRPPNWPTPSARACAARDPTALLPPPRRVCRRW